MNFMSKYRSQVVILTLSDFCFVLALSIFPRIADIDKQRCISQTWKTARPSTQLDNAGFHVSNLTFSTLGCNTLVKTHF